MKKNKKPNGFTLFELLVSISIIAILTALATVSYSNAQKKARNSRRIQDLKNVQTAAEQFYSANSFVYPAEALFVTGKSWDVRGQNILQSFPEDPKFGDGEDGYHCASDALTTTYYCCAKLEDNTKEANSYDDHFAITTPDPLAEKTYFCVKNQQ